LEILMSRWQIARRSLIESEIVFLSAFISTRVTSRLPAGWKLITPRTRSLQAPLWLRGCLSYGGHFPSCRILKVKGSPDPSRKLWLLAHERSIGARNLDNFL